MKQLLFLSLTVWLNIVMQSCQDVNVPNKAQDSDLNLDIGSAKTPSILLTNSQSTDTTRASPIRPLNVDSINHITCIQKLRTLDESSIDPSEVLVELPEFIGQNISESSAYLFLINEDTLKLYIDYFEGDIKGSKVFYIAAGELLGIDILAVDKQWTESGEQINSQLTHSFYYKDKALLGYQNYRYPQQQVLLEEENKRDWRSIRRSLQIL